MRIVKKRNTKGQRLFKALQPNQRNDQNENLTLTHRHVSRRPSSIQSRIEVAVHINRVTNKGI